jgi:hypothetical protein
MDSPQSSAAGSTSRSVAVAPAPGRRRLDPAGLACRPRRGGDDPVLDDGPRCGRRRHILRSRPRRMLPGPPAERSPWRWLYAADSTLTAGMALVPLGLIVFARRSRRARRVAAFLFLSAALGPGSGGQHDPQGALAASAPPAAGGLRWRLTPMCRRGPSARPRTAPAFRRVTSPSRRSTSATPSCSAKIDRGSPWRVWSPHWRSRRPWAAPASSPAPTSCRMSCGP